MADLPFLLWDHQTRAIAEAAMAVQHGYRSICVASPTGSGKTVMMSEIALRAAAKGRHVVLLTNRRILIEQTADQLDKHGVKFSTISASHGCYYPGRLVSLCSVQTIDSRVLRRKTLELPPASILILDEAHSTYYERFRAAFREQNPQLVELGFTATPIGISGYTKLIVAARNSELLERGVLVPCETYSISAPDMSGVKIVRGDYSAAEAEDRMTKCTVFGDLYAYAEKLNPNKAPTVLFAPGVAFSRGMVQQFNERGWKSAHVDGQTPDHIRDKTFADLASGAIHLVSSCGVLREGWNCPAVRHGILAQPTRSLGTYLQIVGRLLRSYPGKTHAILQDHSGATWRHGDPNEDREWQLGDTEKTLAEAREQKPPEEKAPITCPECHHDRKSGPVCPNCGFRFTERLMFIKKEDGQLVRVRVTQKRKKEPTSEAQKYWNSLVFGARSSGNRRTFSQCAEMYRKKHGEYPPSGLEFMPEKGSLDWKRAVVSVIGPQKKKSA